MAAACASARRVWWSGFGEALSPWSTDESIVTGPMALGKVVVPVSATNAMMKSAATLGSNSRRAKQSLSGAERKGAESPFDRPIAGACLIPQNGAAYRARRARRYRGRDKVGGADHDR